MNYKYQEPQIPLKVIEEILNQIPSIITITDPSGHVIYQSPAKELIESSIIQGFANGFSYEIIPATIRTDEKTGLYSYSGIIEEYKKMRSNSSVYVIMADLDNFKIINDTYGHNNGDEALSFVSEELKKLAKITGGAVGRYGGDEFTIILPTDKPIEYYANLLKDFIFVLNNNFVLENGTHIPISMTFGIALDDHTKTIKECLEAADTALYEGKKSEEKGQIVLFSDPDIPHR